MVDDELLEGQRIGAAQRRLVDDRIKGHPLGLGVVADEVLGGGCDTLALDAVNQSATGLCGQHGVLAERLEVAPAVGRSVQVDRRAKQHVDAIAPRFRPDETAGPLDQLG